MATPAEWIALLVENAQALRASGVTRIQLGDCVVELSPFDSRSRNDDIPAALSALDDPATWGGRVPGYPRREE